MAPPGLGPPGSAPSGCSWRCKIDHTANAKIFVPSLVEVINSRVGLHPCLFRYLFLDLRFCPKDESLALKSPALRSCHKRQKTQAPTPQAPIRYRQTRKVANAKDLNRNTNLTKSNLT